MTSTLGRTVAEGHFWWKWEERNDRPWLRNDPRGDKGFPVWGKPAAGVFKEWSTKLPVKS